MESEYRENETPLLGDGLVTTRISCKGRGSLFHEVSVIRCIDRYLRLDELRIVLVSAEEDGLNVIDASDHLNGEHTLLDGLKFVESRMGSIDMFEMVGVWRDTVSVLVVHIKGRPFLSVLVPIEVSPITRRRIAKDVRQAISLAEV